MHQSVIKSIELPYSPAQMFALVDRVEDYPLFLPWCLKAEVHSRSATEVQASLQVGKGAIVYALSTLNRLDPSKRITMQLVAGPVKSLEGSWHFEANSQGSKVSLELNFELNFLLHKALTPFIDPIGDRLMQAFCARARQLYG